MQYQYAVVIEKAPSNYAAYVPDLPGCVTTGKTLEETERLIGEAIALYLEVSQERGEPVPEPTSRAITVSIEAPPAA